MTNYDPKQEALLEQARNLPYDKHSFARQMRVITNYLLHTLPLSMDGTQALAKTHKRVVPIRRKIEQVHQSKQAIIKDDDGNPVDRISINAIAEAVIQMILHDGVNVGSVTAMPKRRLLEKALPHHKILKKEAEAKLHALLNNPKNNLKKLLNTIPTYKKK